MPASRTYAISLMLAAVLLLASTTAYLVAGEGLNDGVLGGTLGVWACFALVVGYVGIARSFEPVAPRAATVLLVLALVGTVTGASYNVLAIHLAAVGENFHTASIADSDQIGFLAFDPWGLFGPIAFLMTAWLIWRTPLFASWSAAPFLLGGLLFIPARESGSGLLALVADTGLAVGLVAMAVGMLSGHRAPDKAPEIV